MSEEPARVAVRLVGEAGQGRTRAAFAGLLRAVIAVAAGQLAWVSTHERAADALRNVAAALDRREGRP